MSRVPSMALPSLLAGLGSTRARLRETRAFRKTGRTTGRSELDQTIDSIAVWTYSRTSDRRLIETHRSTRRDAKRTLPPTVALFDPVLLDLREKRLVAHLEADSGFALVSARLAEHFPDEPCLGFGGRGGVLSSALRKTSSSRYGKPRGDVDAHGA